LLSALLAAWEKSNTGLVGNQTKPPFETALGVAPQISSVHRKTTRDHVALSPYRAPLARVANRLYFPYIRNIVARAGEGFA
jgi:hypothetical protein